MRSLGRTTRGGVVAAVAVGVVAAAVVLTGSGHDAAPSASDTEPTSTTVQPTTTVATTTTVPATTTAPTTTAPPTTAAPTPTPTAPPAPLVPSGVCTGRVSGGVPADRFPGAACTGVVAGSALTPHGGMRITQAGSTWENLDVSGDICVAADDVTIRNSRVAGIVNVASDSGFGGCGLSGGAHNLTLVDVEVRPDDPDAVAIEGGVYRPGITCVRCNLHRAGAAINGGLYTLTDTYIHDLLGHGSDPATWSHNDGIQVGGAGGNVVVRHSNIEATYAPESSGGGMSCALCLYSHGDPNSGEFSWGPMDDVLIERSRIQSSDAAFCAYGGDSNDQNPTNIRYVDNVFVRGGSDTCGLDGPIVGWRQGGGNRWSNNRFSDGEVIPEPTTEYA